MQLISELFNRNFWLAGFGLANLILFLIALMFSFADRRLVNGINTWAKPMKFALTLWIYSWTLAWLFYCLPQKDTVSIISRIIVVSLIIEQALIFFQASRAVASHFNTTTVLNGIIFTSMGIAIFINTLAISWATGLYFFPVPALSAAYLWSVRIGLLIFLLASIEGGYMASKLSHHIGTVDEAGNLPFLNWSGTGGDLRIAHFVGIHALQVLPVSGWLLDRFQVRQPVACIMFTGLAYFSLTAFLFLRALKGRPLYTKS